ncbi:PKG_37 [Blepharisma stoltei]|uniref:cGMP-dependent protein kinase n=1 Tax=Blepharisma stoltei TaxID=1481888 RepID=A0AAU9K8S6_9CILI|nr:unnamed protein product [Blepharisma stoltei]
MGNCAGRKKSVTVKTIPASASNTYKKSETKLSSSIAKTTPQTEEFKNETNTNSVSNARKMIKKKAPVADHRKKNLEDVDAPNAIVTEKIKSEREIEDLRKSLAASSLFSSLPEENLRLIIDQMKYYTLGAREVVFNQGQPGNNFFIVASGRVEIIVNGETKGFLSKGKGFGELALLHDSLRTATIMTLDKATLWGIGRQAFRSAVESVSNQKYIENKNFIDHVPILSMLTPAQKDALLAVMVSQDFEAGQKIVSEGDPGDLFYVIKDGVVSCTVKGNEIRQLGKGDFFGEQALLYNTTRTATVTAISKVSIFSLGREDLTRVLGDQLQQIIYRNTQRISIEKSQTLKVLTKSQAETVIDKMKVTSYHDGQIMIDKNSPKLQMIWIVLKGNLVSLHTTIGVFQCIGDMDFLQPNITKYEASYAAVGDTDVAEISWMDLEACIGGRLANVSQQNQVLGILRRVQLLRALSVSKLEQLASALRVRDFMDQEPVFMQGDPGDAFYIVKEGQVEIYKDGVSIRTIIKHDFFGERSIILQENRTATAISKGPTSCWILDKQQFLNLIDENIRNQILKRMELQNDSVHLNDLSIIKTLGKGMFGNVFLAVHKKIKTPYALKTVHRSKIHAFQIHDNLVLERKILLELDHPLIMKLVKTFKDPDRIYFLTEFVRGQDLFDVLRVLNLLTNEWSKFYAGCIFLMLEHLHERNIIYRDLKPENIMVDEYGYPKLIDFGTAKQIDGRTYTVVGTPHYMAPEVIIGKGYGLAADYWSVGIMIFEFFCGIVPFGEDEEDPYKIYEKVIERRLIYPPYVGQNMKAAPFIEMLLSKNPSMRGTVETVKEHKWFQGMDWDGLLGKQLKPPYVPKLESLAGEIEHGLKRNKDVTELIMKEEINDLTEIPKKRGKAPPEDWDHDF